MGASRFKQPLNVIASEAKQSMEPRSKSGLLRRFAPRNDGALRYDSAIPRHDLPEVCKNVRRSENRGRRECRAHDAPQPRGRKKKGTRA